MPRLGWPSEGEILQVKTTKCPEKVLEQLKEHNVTERNFDPLPAKGAELAHDKNLARALLLIATNLDGTLN